MALNKERLEELAQKIEKDEATTEEYKEFIVLYRQLLEELNTTLTTHQPA